MISHEQMDILEEGASIRRLAKAGTQNDDLETLGVAVSRAVRLTSNTGANILDIDLGKIFNLPYSNPEID